MFDASYLSPALHEFVVIADTHSMLAAGGQSVEFASRRQQTARAEFALRTVAGLGDLPVIHMGDLVQEFPERPHFAQALDQAQAQLAACGVAPRLVAGNHDIGDKPDPTMPADWVTPAYLDDHHRRFGLSWQSWDEAGLHFVIVNSQILNSGLPAEAEQARWLEADLQRHARQRIFLFLHLPPFLHNPGEAALGHYDNIDESARSWLLELVQHYRVEMLFAAHVHWAFYNEMAHPNGATRYYTAPSVSFTRPGFSELFSSPPPPEQGRDDVGKLGFYLVRVHEDGSRVHFVRTAGATGAPDPRPRLLTRLSPDLPASALGVVLHHPLCHASETPSVWPSAVRQPVRNDYPLLACLELGVRHLLVPLADLADPLQGERLEMLRRQGVQVTARILWRPVHGLARCLAGGMSHCDGMQVDVTGDVLPAPMLAKELRAWKAGSDRPVTLSCVVPGRRVAGKQHSRAQVGLRPADVPELDDWLGRHNLTVDRVLCRLDTSGESRSIVSQIEDMARPARIGALDWVVELPTAATGLRLNAVAEALFALASQPGSRIFFEPFIDLDRTMDVTEGLLDRLCNPRPVFQLLRHLNTLLFSQSVPVTPAVETGVPGGRLLTRQDAQTTLHLLLPDAPLELPLASLGVDDSHQWRVYDLVSGRRIEEGLPGLEKPGRPHIFEGPTLFL